ncbi:MAG: ComEC/Rec2 family competence protein, partial [Candidatus Peribacteraceae bacterium]|nr:ComEC/Rec2 family competence protein [Candidatus Peribacteraceae bacterium]
HWFEGTLNLLFPEPHASLAAGLLTGSRRGLPAGLLADFTAVGLTHIIAISGTNITIIMTLIAGLLFWLPFRWRLIPTIFAITAFTFFVGASASVVRAAIMGSLGLLAVTLGRQADTRLAILWTAAAMTFWNPARLWWDGGFQLSFAAVIGLTELTPILQPLLHAIPKTLGLRESLLTTIAAQLTAMPLTILLFGNLSIIAPIANVLVAPVIPIAMLFGAVSVAAGALWIPLGKLVALPGWMCLSWIVGVAQTLARVPGASFHFERASVILLMLYYIILAGIVLCFRKIPIWNLQKSS